MSTDDVSGTTRQLVQFPQIPDSHQKETRPLKALELVPEFLECVLTAYMLYVSVLSRVPKCHGCCLLS